MAAVWSEKKTVSCARRCFEEMYVPTSHETFTTLLSVDQRRVELTATEIGGSVLQAAADRPQADGILLVFSLIDRYVHIALIKTDMGHPTWPA